MRARVLIPAALALVALLAGPAASETRPPEGDAYIDDDGSPTIEVTDDDATDDSTPGSAGGSACTWRVAIADDAAMKVYGEDGRPQHSSTGRWRQKLCDGAPVAVGGRFLVPEGGVVDVEALARRALASVDIAPPALYSSPDANDRLYVRVPTWLWIDAGWWQPYQATASAGRITATVTAQPVRTTWEPGDGAIFDCVGPGQPWRSGLSEHAGTCTHTYTSSSATTPTGTVELDGRVHLQVTWTSNVGHDETLPAITRSATRTVIVGEIQAIGTATS